MTGWGLLSTARINRAILAGIAAVSDARAVAVASRDAGRASAYARANGIERAHGSYEALLADPDVDIVY
ncbi:MAG: gfo/Idh/MocA family oxidoreductase, partial [Actinomycetota bacterium]|nr:gfo/Idh/MocA family oxidoreductase [Actinomycetota bacterium]